MKLIPFATLLALPFPILVALTGCGSNGAADGPSIPVQGTILLGKKPLVGGTIQFIPPRGGAGLPRPEGTIDAQGRYALKTAGAEGAPVGKYRAVVTVSGQDRRQSAQFNPLYSHWEKSPLAVEVKENAPPGTYDLKLIPLQKP